MTTYHLKQLINGEWVNAGNGNTWDLVNPATEEVIQQVPFGNGDDANQAIDAAHTAFKLWSAKTPYERGEVLMGAAQWIIEHLEDISIITTEESGKPLAQSRGEWLSATNYLKWYAEEAKRDYGRLISSRSSSQRIMVHKVPVGVVGTITAWNFPIYNVNRSWAAALAAGCTVVGRPSEYTPRSAMLLAQALADSGAPAGVINVINGDPAEMGQAMLDDPRVRKISFTGSTRVGKLLMEGSAKTVTRLSLELGGNAPVLIFPDSDMAKVAQLSLGAKFFNCGQVCIAPQRFFVHSQVVEEFTDYATQRAGQVVVGNGLNAGTDLGPLINATQRNRVESLVSRAVTQGAEVLVGGGRPADMDKGYFYQPTIVSNIKTDMPLYHEEIFGPVVPIIPFDDMDEAIALANDTEYGLASYVYTNNLNTALHVSEQLEYGMVGINGGGIAVPEAPFGGMKQSGIGRECGLEGMEDYMETKSVVIGNVL